MKSRRYNLIIGVFVMFISNIIYFFWMPYPKGFLKTVGSTTFVFDVLTNLLFFSLYSVMLIISRMKNRMWYRFKILIGKAMILYC